MLFMTSGKHENILYIIWAPNQLLYQYYTDKAPLKVHLIYSLICERMSMERPRGKRYQWAPNLVSPRPMAYMAYWQIWRWLRLHICIVVVIVGGDVVNVVGGAHWW